ncbi:MAG: hypothetical protein PHN89_05790 [Candidatus Pacebacteria bacterium]|nr:hypothetical protein [Candidatus Paceibacterota bacterium]
MNKLLQGVDYTREKVRLRDNYTCQKCFRVWKEGERRFDCHHLNGLCGKRSKKYDKVKDLQGLITLCHKCHMSLGSNRKKMSDARGGLSITPRIIKYIKESKQNHIPDEEIGAHLGITHQRVQQIRMKLDIPFNKKSLPAKNTRIPGVSLAQLPFHQR